MGYSTDIYLIVKFFDNNISCYYFCFPYLLHLFYPSIIFIV